MVTKKQVVEAAKSVYRRTADHALVESADATYIELLAERYADSQISAHGGSAKKGDIAVSVAMHIVETGHNGHEEEEETA